MVKRTTVAMGLMLVAGALGAGPTNAEAQENRLRVSFGAAATAGTGESRPALVGSVGYRFANRLVFEVEGTGFTFENDRFQDLPFALGNVGGPAGVRGGNDGRFGMVQGQVRNVLGNVGGIGGIAIGSRLGFQNIDSAIYPPIRGGVDGNTMIGTVGFRYEFPVDTGRLTPYVSAGFGASRTERTLEYSIATIQAGPRGAAVNTSTRMDRETMARTGIAASLGVGASLRVFKQFSVDVDARYFRLDGNRDLGRLGGGVSYRF